MPWYVLLAIIIAVFNIGYIIGREQGVKVAHEIHKAMTGDGGATGI